MIQREDKFKAALQTISMVIDNMKYELSGRVYTIDEDEMSWIFYCRDLADKALREE